MTKSKPSSAIGKPAVAVAKRKELHFFPGERQMIWLVGERVELRAEAWGGEAPVPGRHYEVMPPQPTTPGKYVIYSYEPYRTNTWIWSRIPWGTRLITQFDKGEEKVFYATGLASPQWKPVEGLSKADIESNYYALHGEYKVPETWVFNDFGAKAVRYFKDANHNRRLDRGERLSGEMIHTTPVDEARTARSLEVSLVASHGCIHVKPLDRDRFHAAGAFARGTDLIIHGYDERLPKDYR